MKRSRSYLAVATLSLLLGCALGAGVLRLVMPAARAAEVQRWNYYCFEEFVAADDIMAKAKAAGRQGWEMVMGYSLQGKQGICFKRPLVDVATGAPR